MKRLLKTLIGLGVSAIVLALAPAAQAQYCSYNCETGSSYSDPNDPYDSYDSYGGSDPNDPYDSYDTYGDSGSYTDPNDPYDSYDSYGDSGSGFTDPNDPYDSYDTYGDSGSYTDPNDPYDSYDSYGDSDSGFNDPNDPYDSWDSYGSLSLSWDQFELDTSYNESLSDYFDQLGTTSDWDWGSYQPDSSSLYDFDSYWGSSYDGDVDCPDVGRQIYVGGLDAYNLDADGDGFGCEDWS